MQIGSWIRNRMDPHWFWSAGSGSWSAVPPVPNPDPGGQKWPTKKKKWRMFWSVGFFLFESFFCIFNVLYGFPEISKQHLTQKLIFLFPFKIFLNCSSKPWIRNRIQNRFQIGNWIRIRNWICIDIKCRIRIHIETNADPGSATLVFLCSFGSGFIRNIIGWLSTNNVVTSNQCGSMLIRIRILVSLWSHKRLNFYMKNFLKADNR